jgi:hypothetical protein
MADLDSKIKELEEKVDKLYADYSYLVSAGNLQFSDKHFSTHDAIQLRSFSDNSTRYTVMRFSNPSDSEGIELAFDIWTTYGQTLVYKQHGQYKFLYRIPYSDTDLDKSLADLFSSIPTLEGDANEKLIETVTLDMDGHNIEPIPAEFLTSNQTSG